MYCHKLQTATPNATLAHIDEARGRGDATALLRVSSPSLVVSLRNDMDSRYDIVCSEPFILCSSARQMHALLALLVYLLADWVIMFV